jgi:hypothetical protein
MVVHDILAEQMVGERVAALLIVGHQTCSLQRRRRALCRGSPLSHGRSSRVKSTPFKRARKDTGSLRRPGPVAQIGAVYTSHEAHAAPSLPKVLNSTPRNG